MIDLQSTPIMITNVTVYHKSRVFLVFMVLYMKFWFFFIELVTLLTLHVINSRKKLT